MSASDLPVTVPGVGVPPELVDMTETGLYAPCPMFAAGQPDPPDGFTHGARVGGVLDASWVAGLGGLVADFRSDPDVSEDFDVPADYRRELDAFVESRGLTVSVIDSTRFRRLVSDGHMGVPVTFEPLPEECRLAAVNAAVHLDVSLRAVGHPGFVALARQLDQLDATEFAGADPLLRAAAGDLLGEQLSVVSLAGTALGDVFASALTSGDSLDVLPVCPAALVADQLLVDAGTDPWGWLAPTAIEQGSWSGALMLCSADVLETAMALEAGGVDLVPVDLVGMLIEALDWSPVAPLLLTLITGATRS